MCSLRSILGLDKYSKMSFLNMNFRCSAMKVPLGQHFEPECDITVNEVDLKTSVSATSGPYPETSGNDAVWAHLKILSRTRQRYHFVSAI